MYLSVSSRLSISFGSLIVQEAWGSAYMVRLLSGVDAQVALERLQVSEACSTDLTRIRLLTRVDQHVGSEMSDLTGRREQKTKSSITL